MDKNVYGSLISRLRQNNNMTTQELANILLITPEKMMRVEAGEEILTDSELTLCANVLDASSAALRKGEYRPRTTAAELEESLGKFQELYKAAAKSEAAILDMLQELNPSERYRGRYLDEQTATRTAGFAIYDSLTADYVRDEKGEPLMYATAKEAFQAVKELEEKLAYFDEMKESLSQSVILAQETAEKVKASAADESANLINKANFNATHLVEEAKSKASEILRDATDEAKRVAIETEELKRQSRVFHQRLLAAVEGQLSLASAPEWGELLQPTAIYLQNSDAAFKEVVEKVLDEHVPDSNDAASFDATRQFTPDEMAELQRRVAESNKQVEDFSSPEVDETNEVVSTPVDFGIPDTFESEVADFPTSAPVDEDFDLQPESTGEINLNETQTFKLNISE